MLENFLWTEKYRPRNIDDTILPAELKATFHQFIEQQNVPNLILAGSAGVGKTTVARALLEEIGSDYIVINGSMNGNIDTLRNEILNFASAVSFTGKRKYVILDEADYLNANSTQPALRNFMEEFSKNCGFILTCNLKNRIIPPLHSRCTIVDFKISKKDSAKLAAQFMKRVENILTIEKIMFDRQVVASVIQKFYPDWRRVLNELQRYAASGSIDTGILTNFQDLPIHEIYKLCKNKEFDALRKWSTDNSDIEQNEVFRVLYESCDKYINKKSIPLLILFIAEYQYKGSFVANPELNLLAFFVEIMREIEYL